MSSNRALRVGMHTLLLSVAVLYGMLSYRFSLPPYPLVKGLYTALLPDRNEERASEYTTTEVSKLISITQPSQVQQLRDQLINILWGEQGLPARLPNEIIRDIADECYQDLPSLARVDKLTILMEFDLDSHVHHLIPENPNNKVVLYHRGHHGDMYNSKSQIGTLLESGYSVLTFWMPLFGHNNRPVIEHPKLGNLKLTSHDQMRFLTPEDGHPVKYFIEPIIIALNYLEENSHCSSVSMIGISGGGWATTVAAALDERISRSFPVAGSYPMYLRSNSITDWGDYEQQAPEIYGVVNYLELYILGSFGAGREQLQIINRYDPCCFAGTKSETYKDIVRARVDSLGHGEFDVLLDESHREHKISEYAMTRILAKL